MLRKFTFQIILQIIFQIAFQIGFQLNAYAASTYSVDIGTRFASATSLSKSIDCSKKSNKNNKICIALKYDQFFQNLGFENYSERMARKKEFFDGLGENLNKTGVILEQELLGGYQIKGKIDNGYISNKGAYENLLQKIKSYEVLQQQIENFKVFENSRILADIILSEVFSKNGKSLEEALVQLRTFTIKMLALSPEKSSIDFNSKDFIETTTKELNIKINNLCRSKKNEDKNKLNQDCVKKMYVLHNFLKTIPNHFRSVFYEIIKVIYDDNKLEKIISNLSNSSDKYSTFVDLRQNVHSMMTSLYTNGVMGLTPYLGKALAAGIKKYSQETSNQNSQFSLLMEEAKASKILVNNFVGNQFQFESQINNEITYTAITVENGDFLMERSVGQEAGNIISGVKSAYPYDLFAIKNRLGGIGSFVSMFFTQELTDSYENIDVFVDDLEELLEITDLTYENLKESESPAAKKFLENFEKFIQTDNDIIKFLNKTVLMKDYFKPIVFNIVIEQLRNEILEGYSHVGIAMKKTDPETGISMVWSIDNYPNKGRGGIRITDITRQFARPGLYMKFGVARYDAEKFLKYAKTEKFEKTFSPSDKKGSNFPKSNDPNKIWTVLPTAEENFKEILATPDDKAQEWYKKSMEKVTQNMIEGMLEKGLAFAYSFDGSREEAFCSSAIWISIRQTLGIDAQKYEDTWHPVIIGLKKSGFKGTSTVNPEERIIGPAGFAWQEDLVDPSSIVNVTFPAMTKIKRFDSVFNSTRAFDSEVQKISDLIYKINYSPLSAGEKKPKLNFSVDFVNLVDMKADFFDESRPSREPYTLHYAITQASVKERKDKKNNESEN